MKRIFLAAALAVAALLALPAAAQAHVAAVSPTCDGLTVTLAKYSPASRNVVEITVDGTASSAQVFGRSVTKHVPWDSSIDNTWTVTVTAGDDPTGSHGWTFTKSGTQVACSTPTQSPTTSPTTSPTSSSTSTPCPPGSHQAQCHKPTPSQTASSPTRKPSSTSTSLAAAPVAAVCSSKGLACTGGFDRPALYAGGAVVLVGFALVLAAGFRQSGPKHRGH